MLLNSLSDPHALRDERLLPATGLRLDRQLRYEGKWKGKIVKKINDVYEIFV